MEEGERVIRARGVSRGEGRGREGDRERGCRGEEVMRREGDKGEVDNGEGEEGRR